MNDDELLARLKSADPALTTSAPPPDIARLVEATLNTDTDTDTDSNTDSNADTAPAPTTRPAKAAAGRGRRQLLGLAAAAGLLLLGGGIAGGIMANDGNGHPASAGPLTLTSASGSAGSKCVEPTPDRLRAYPTLFAGTVTSVKGAMVTFHVDYWLKGGGTGTVVLDSGVGEPERLAFSAGERYIVAAKDGVVPACGANWASADTLANFRRAYGK